MDPHRSTETCSLKGIYTTGQLNSASHGRGRCDAVDRPDGFISNVLSEKKRHVKAPSDTPADFALREQNKTTYEPAGRQRKEEMFASLCEHVAKIERGKKNPPKKPLFNQN